MVDAVLSHHTNPLTCGTAKFNHQLAQRLGVPLRGIMPWSGPNRFPLVSLKIDEMGTLYHDVFFHADEGYDLLLHDRTLPEDSPLYRQARRVLYADELGIPATIQGNPHRGGYRVLTFGMAHKLALPHFEQLKTFLDRDRGADYTISLSTAVHEGHPWEGTLESSAASMRAIFGDKLRVLGFLADDALAKEIQDCDAMAMFFEPAMRANNTSAWAAIAAGKRLFTNRDEHSPSLANPPTWEHLIGVLRGA